ncbi:hypothetical protein CO051_03045 [Candidatus Roizmanbacteria bacterium CG_4_9_14_0_2_um_filter_39_13]|uniref:BrnT family toxin n=2 Tax=Candidatus Roizmaniibacteriota TaxID=1752723 RepID=A0A2M8EZQ7_9BACT|nr:MAG: hypothetical protein COY15_03130 [Candidatus Roizmanbacteria bacterium CG_4_10_14_0_2_um_filter_39_12]PJC32514.1 MAG: hypothetical protein CO051_03045 [Candidatus Roizmanbacteria bacterium CG_4_9_14_0_2_um_filter_39_13]PJE61901.1 MAG: hypothetical protein COU87_02065 [Candidatus Roizmanbacteria bacterium CG10_big_fil_rev_8_21_14_0_10_39_12]
MKVLSEPIRFEWDRGNVDKNLIKHKVTNSEIEEVFYDRHKKIFKDTIHSGNEKRLRILGKTKHDRLLFIVFTIRNQRVRIISARDLNRKEVSLYEKN